MQIGGQMRGQHRVDGAVGVGQEITSGKGQENL